MKIENLNDAIIASDKLKLPLISILWSNPKLREMAQHEIQGAGTTSLIKHLTSEIVYDDSLFNKNKICFDEACSTALYSGKEFYLEFILDFDDRASYFPPEFIKKAHELKIDFLRKRMLGCKSFQQLVNLHDKACKIDAFDFCSEIEQEIFNLKTWQVVEWLELVWGQDVDTRKKLPEVFKLALQLASTEKEYTWIAKKAGPEDLNGKVAIEWLIDNL